MDSVLKEVHGCKIVSAVWCDALGRTVTVGHCTREMYPASSSSAVQFTFTYGTFAHFAAVSSFRSRLFRRSAPAVAPDAISPISRPWRRMQLLTEPAADATSAGVSCM